MPRSTRRSRALPGVALASLGLLATAALAAAQAGSASASPSDPPADGARSEARSVYRELTGSVTAARSSRPATRPRDYVKMDLLALNDFHGNLETIDPARSSSGRINNTPAGGVAYLATLLKQERAKSRAAGATPVTVAAGDLIGASPLLSAAFHDEPAIKALNRVGLQVASVGNHEFDEGYRELLRMQRGGCLADGDGRDGQDSCPEGTGFGGAEFQYLGANVKWAEQGERRRDTVLPATKVVKVGGEKVGFIGMTLEGTASIVSQAGIQGITFEDEVRTANRLVPQLRKRGVESIVVLLHEGVFPTDSTAYNSCTGVSGPALTIAQNLKPAIDAVVSGHTHQPYNCVVRDPAGQNRLLTSAASFGRMVSKLHFLIDPRNGDIVRPAAFAENRIVENTGGVEADSRLTRLIATYNRLVQPIANEVLGQIAGTDRIVKDPADPDGGDSALGNLIADAQKADTSIVQGGREPVVAFMNPGGIRADLLENANGDVTYGAAFAVQPFNNFVVSMDLTGAQIRAVLNEQWNGANEGSAKILQVSGLEYTWDRSLAAQPTTDAVVDVLVDADGDPGTPAVPLEDGTTYRVAANNFIADGGDNFPTFPDGTDRLVGGLDIDSLRQYLLAESPVEPTPTDRISAVD